MASPAHGPYGLVETRNDYVKNIPDSLYTIKFGAHRKGTYYISSYNGNDILFGVYTKYKHEDDYQWRLMAEFGAYRSGTIELFLYDGVDYKIVGKVLPNGNSDRDYSIYLGLNVWSKYAYFASDFENCNNFPAVYGDAFICGENKWCRKTSNDWSVNGSCEFWCFAY